MSEENKEIVKVEKKIDIERFPIGEERQNLMEWMKLLAEAPFYKKMGGLPAMVSMVLTGREIGISPMNCLNGAFWDIQGRISMSAEMQRARFRQAGHSLKIVTLTEKLCTLKGKRKDNNDECEMTFTIEDATRSGLTNRDNWKKHPKDMLLASCTRKVVRFLAPELLGCTGVEEGEIIDITPEAEEPKKLDKDTALFIENYNLNNLNCAASRFIDGLATNMKVDRSEIIATCAKDPARFEEGLKKFKEQEQEDKN